MHFQKNNDFKELIFSARSQKKNKLPFVLYQKPKENVVKGMFSTDDNLTYTKNFAEKGFVFSPFNEEKAILLCSNDLREVPYKGKYRASANSKVELVEDKQEHLLLVNKAIQRIAEGALKKVVVSRKIEVATEKDVFALFQDLLDTYPNALKYLWYHPQVGMWIGATPETLLKMDKNAFSTTSLAGTLPVIEGETPFWSRKEIEEQQVVTDYILDIMSKKLTQVKVTSASTVSAGKLWHLKSSITGLLKKEIGLDEVITALHPTPAVCGIPKESSKEFIIKNEGYDREFYTGFLGELNFDDATKTHLFVNLRCMKLFDKKAVIFIGGGITSRSNAQREWKETQHKSKTMLNLL